MMTKFDLIRHSDGRGITVTMDPADIRCIEDLRCYGELLLAYAKAFEHGRFWREKRGRFDTGDNSIVEGIVIQ